MLKKNKSILIFVIFVANNIIWISLFLNYNDNSSNVIEKKKMESAFNINELKQKILLEGDNVSYQKLKDLLVDEKMSPDSFLFWAIIWGNKYKNPSGYYDVFECLSATCSFGVLNGENYISECELVKDGVNYISLEHLDEDTQVMALKYLKKAAENDIPQAIEQLDKYRELNIYQTSLSNPMLVRESFAF